MAPVTILSRQSVEKAAAIIMEGGLVVIPTDTVYGLACDPFNKAAVGRLFEAKKRESKPIPVLCADIEKARELVELGPLGSDLAKKFWPGALTIVAQLRRAVPRQVDQGTETLGVRVPAHPMVLELIERSGGWTTGTSANLSGNPSSRNAGEASAQIGDAVDMVLDGGSISGVPSTVVSVAGGGVAILRSGQVRVPEAMVR
jgi:L-threonylcarbamoyladenylate synthase